MASASASVGITGPPDEVRPRPAGPSPVTLLIGHQQALLARADRQGRRDLLAERLVTHVGKYPALLVADAGEFGLDLRTPHEAVSSKGCRGPRWTPSSAACRARSCSPPPCSALARSSRAGGVAR